MSNEINFQNPTKQEIKELLDKVETIAVVGISAKQDRDSYYVARYLKQQGYKVVPVNPQYDEVLGEKCYPDLKSIPEHVDVVDIFRKPDAVPQIVDEAIEIKADVIWMQYETYNAEAAQKALDAGLKVIADKCIKVEHSF